MLKRRTLGVSVLVLAAAAVGSIYGARFLARTHAAAPPVLVAPDKPVSVPAIELHVPRAKTPIVIDDELDDEAWQRATARTNAFVLADGSPARPYSDARLVWRDDSLYIGLYAADEDIEATQKNADAPLWVDDSFHLELGAHGTRAVIEVSPLATFTDGKSTNGGAIDWAWSSGAKLAVDVDGTIGDPSDDDEEWVIEMAIPLASIGAKGAPGERIAFRVHRCDKPKPAPRVCASYGENSPGVVLVLDQ